MQRRTLLGTIGTGVVTIAAGCSTGSGGTDNANGNNATPTTTSSSGPEAVVQGYFNALNEGDKAAANEHVLNEEVPMYVEEAEQREITVHTVARRDLRTVINDTQDVSGSTLDDRVERNRESLNGRVEENEQYSDWAWVYISITSEEYGQEEGYYLLYKVDGDWKLAGLTN